MNHLPYRPNVCIILTNQSGELLIGERIDRPGSWQFPQGGVEGEGSIEESVYREIEEELGIARHHVCILEKLTSTHTYDFVQVPSYAVNVWRGQTQTFWLVLFQGTDADINIATAHPEFSNWRWYAIEEVLTAVDPIRYTGYEKPLKEVPAVLERHGICTYLSIK